MKYTTEIVIRKPLDKVVQAFDDPANLSKWMKGLTLFEHLSGEPGQPGAKSRLHFDLGKRKMVLTETVLKRNLPDEFDGVYEAPGVNNIVRNRFVALGPNETKYITEQEFNFSGFMKVFGFLMPGVFKKQTRKYQEDFKAFVEGLS